LAIRDDLVKPHNETEIKLRVLDLPALRRRLKQLKAQQVSPRTHEFNTLYDTSRQDLRRRGQMIRLRVEQPASRPGQGRRASTIAAILTYKGPAHARSNDSPRRLKKNSRYKVRQEFEVKVTDADHMRRILNALSLKPSFRYEKFRTTYTLRGQRNLKIELDETPIGTFVELEGSRSSIDRVAGLLGYAPSTYITQTYGTLHVAYRRRMGLKPADMLF
jgi:adenylate cyclase class IV